MNTVEVGGGGRGGSAVTVMSNTHYFVFILKLPPNCMHVFVSALERSGRKHTKS